MLGGPDRPSLASKDDEWARGSAGSGTRVAGGLLSECRARTGGMAAIIGMSAWQPRDTFALGLQKRVPQAARGLCKAAAGGGARVYQRHAHLGDSNVARDASSQTHQHPGHGQEATALGHARRFSDH